MDDLNRINSVFEKQKQFFFSDATKDINFRLEQLQVLYNLIVDNQEKIFEALAEDLGKSDYEAFTTEIGYVLSEISLFRRNLKYWAKPKRVPTPITAFSGKSYIYYEPYGVVLIMSPWNYPFQLVIAPLIGAIAAGNTAILKPSPLSTATSTLLKELIEKHFSEEYLAVFEGGVEVAKALLEKDFDFIFFTGSEHTGKIVMEYAAKHLTPIVLELGGKSPTIVDVDADLKYAAKSIAWGKFLNAGQTCIAPDYVLAQELVYDELIFHLSNAIEHFYGKDPKKSKYYPKIIDTKNIDRLYSYLKCGNVYYGGVVDREARYFSPTILTNVDLDCDVMKYEIFGPILPVIKFSHLDEAISFVKSRPKPLALYYFGKKQANIEKILKSTSSGGVAINDTIMHFVNPNLPFGGVGNSGIGKYHGKFSFETFSNKKAVYSKNTWIDLPFRYLPANKFKWWVVKKLLK